MIKRFNSKILGINSSLVYNEEAAFIIDPGVFPEEISQIKNFVSEQGIYNISVLLTHIHGDHISGWHAFQNYPTFAHKIISEKSQIVRENDVRYLQGINRKQGINKKESLVFPHDILYVEEGIPQQISPYLFEIFHMPGHSIDMSVVVIPEERVIFSGDMLIHASTPFILNSVFEYSESLNKLQLLIQSKNIQYLIPGHGKPAENMTDILERISQESSYIQRMIITGTKLIKDGVNDNELKENLILSYHQYRILHSHQMNVLTLLRERDKLLSLTYN